MLFQRILALWDKAISGLFGLQEIGTGDQKGRNRWIYLIDIGHTIGVVGVDGSIRIMSSYWSVNHHRDGKKLLQRIPVRKDLKDGERLATEEELATYQIELRKEFARNSGGLTTS